MFEDDLIKRTFYLLKIKMKPESSRAKEIALENLWAIEQLIKLHKQRLAELEIKKPLETIPEEDFFSVKEVD
jgi:hypothetical protein